MFAIELDRVTLARGGRTVLADVSVAVRLGDFIGVFGPNGAGKTTLLHAILGIAAPFRRRNQSIRRQPTRGNRDAGYLPQQRASVADLGLRGWDFVASALHGERWGLPLREQSGPTRSGRTPSQPSRRSALAPRPLCELSGGELQRLLLAQALLGKPKLLLLDEPLLSLDPHFQQAIIPLVKRIQRSEAHHRALHCARAQSAARGHGSRPLSRSGSRRPRHRLTR